MPYGRKCCVPDCISRNAKSKLALHRLPKNRLTREKWLQTFVNAKLNVAKSSRICSRHFERHQYKNLRKNLLKRGVIPVLFMPKPTTNTVQINLENILPDKSLQDTTLHENSPKLIDNSSELASVPVKSYDFSKTCRICLLEKQDLQNMDSDFIQNMFQSSDIVKFSATDTFPKQICGLCVSELKVVYSFSLKCGKSNDIFRKFTHSEPTANSSVDRKSLSKTVEVSYVPSEADMRNKDDNHRTYKYKLVAVDNIQKTDLLSFARLKQTSLATKKPVLTSTVQAFEIQSSEMQKPKTDSSENENTLSLENISTNRSVFTRNNSSLDANKDFVENKNTKSSNKRMLRKRKSQAIAPVEGKEARKIQTVVPTETNIISNQDATTTVVDLTEETVVHHSRSAGRQSRTAGRISRSKSRSGRMRSRCKRMRSRSRRNRSRSRRKRSKSNRPLRFSTRKKVASGNAVYWYDKPVDSAVNKMNNGVSKALENRNESMETQDTSGDYELLGFDQKGKSIVGDMKRNRGEKSRTDDTAGGSTGSEERNAGSGERNGLADKNARSAERTAGSAKTTGLAERIAVLAERYAGLADRNVGSAKRNAGSAERTAGSAKTTSLAERIAVLAERCAESAERYAGLGATIAGSAERTAGSAETIGLVGRMAVSAATIAGSAERIAGLARKNAGLAETTGLAERNASLVEATVSVERTAGSAETTTDSVETTAQTIMNAHSVIHNTQVKQNTTILKCQSTNINIDEGNITSVVQIQKRGRGRPRKRPYLPPVKLETVCFDTLSMNNTATQLACKIDKCKSENDVTSQLIPKNEKGNTENSITTKCNTKPSKPTTKKYKSAKCNNQIDPAVVYTANNSTLTEKQSSLIVSKTDTLTNTAEQLPTEEPVRSSKDYQRNSNKITKQTKTSIDIVENDSIYMKLRHKTVNFSVEPCKRQLRNSNVNIKHLRISKKEFNRLLNVKLELNKFKMKYNKEGNRNRSKINVGKKKIRIFNTISENRRILRSSKINTFANETSALNNCNGANVKLDKESILQNVAKVDKNKDTINIKPTKVSESNKILLNVQSCEDLELKQRSCLESACSIDKMADSSSANTTVKEITKNIETSETKINTNANVNAVEPKKNIKMELDKCSPDTTTNYDTYSLDSKADLPNNKVENKLKSSTDSSKSSEDSKPEIEKTVSEHAYFANTDESKLYKTECLPETIEQELLANNRCELNPLEKTPVNKAINNSADNESKSQLMQLLQEFVVFDQNRSRTVENTVRNVATEVYSNKNYYQLLDGTNQTDDAQIINSDAMLSNVVKLSPELKAGVPTMYDEELNESFEKSINNILNTEYNTVCDGQLVGSGIVLEDVAATEEVLLTATAPVVYQHVMDKSPKMRVNSDSGYLNKQTEMSSTAEETSNYSSEDEYYANKFHNTQVPSSTDLFEPVQTPTDGRHNNVVRPTSIAEENFPYQCDVCNIAFNTKDQLNSHTIYAEHVTRRFCKHCKQPVDVAEFNAHMKRHENEVFCCEYCGAMVYELKKFLRHSKIHRRHKCKLCPMEFDNKFLLNQHLTVHTGARRDQCRLCHREFARTSALIKHLAARTCLKEKFICTVCKKIFNSKKKTMQHVAQHQRFECTICSRTFSSEKYCINHLKLVHGIIQNE